MSDPAWARFRRGGSFMTVRRSVVVRAVAVAVLLALATPAAADSVSKCAAGKVNCVIKKAKAILGCYKKAAATNFVDPTCITKAQDKFDGGAEPTKGCFEKLENKSPNDCLTVNDTAALEADIDAFAADIVTDLGA